MNNEHINFVKEGILKYKSATNTYFSFRKYVKEELQEILKEKQNWSGFTPNLKSIKSTTYGDSYPLINARVECEYNGQKLTLTIAINWYQADADIPFYCVWFESDSLLGETLNENYSLVQNQLRFYPNFEQLNMKQDFNLLIDEYLSLFSKQNH
ncbi:MAG: hypothetical protein ABL940_00325 [Bacteroidia bacterium]